MDKDKLKKLFHSLFNEINNICVAAGLNKRILEEENLDTLSQEELKAKTSQLVEALGRIDENARTLNKSLQEFYESLAKQTSPPAEN